MGPVTAAGDAVLIQGTVQEISAGTAIVVTRSGALAAVPVTDLEPAVRVVIVRAVQTCHAMPSQWDAWDAGGQYWYLRYRYGEGEAVRQFYQDPVRWADYEPDVTFDTGRGDGEISLEEFCELAGFGLEVPDA
jgi:hypothetical protein